MLKAEYFKAMRKFPAILTLIFLFSCIFATLEIKQNAYAAVTTINVSDYGAVANSGNDAFNALKQAIAAAKSAPKPVVLNFPTGTYDIYATNADKLQYFISNTVSSGTLPDQMRTIGLLFKGINDITIQGNASTLMFHGRMTPLVFDNCTNVTMNNISIDFKRPVVSEITVTKIASNFIEASVHPDSWYSIADGKLTWTGECGWSEPASTQWVAQQYHPATKELWRGWNPVTSASSVQDLGNRVIRLNYSGAPNGACVVGDTYQLRNDKRYEVGAFIYRSKNVNWTDVNYYFAPSLGIVAQYSDTLNFTRFRFAPKAGSGRTCSSMADFMQVSGCKGAVSVMDSYFSGPHDDPINVHGTHLRIVEKPAANQIKVRFVHAESWGFDAFAVNDTIDFIEGASLLVYDSAIVTGIARVNNTDIILTLNKNLPAGVVFNSHYVENATWTPNLTVSGSTFEAVPTRGILVTTRGKVLIENNTFNRTRMSAVLIADDANSWYESGMVRDVTIRNNTFNYCANSVINVEPSTPCTNPDKTVHSNITITGNKFYMNGTTNIYGGGTNGFSFTNNMAQAGGLQLNLKGSKNVTVTGNTFAQSSVTKGISFSNMYTNTDNVDPAQGFSITRSNNYMPMVPGPNDIPKTQMTATATSQHSGNEAGKVLDSNSASIWHSEWTPMANLPQAITMNLGGSYSISKLRYLPRQDGNSNGFITGYSIYTSTNGANFTKVATGTWISDASEKSVSFSPVTASYIRLEATSGAGGFASAAEIAIEKHSSTSLYEAETAFLSGGAVAKSFNGASGGRIVGELGNNSGAVQFNNISADTAGSYNITLSYISGEARNIKMSVNGGTATTISNLNSGGWSVISTATVPITLNAGSNTIKFFNDSGWAPDLDKISIANGVPAAATAGLLQ